MEGVFPRARDVITKVWSRYDNVLASYDNENRLENFPEGDIPPHHTTTWEKIYELAFGGCRPRTPAPL